VDVLSSAAHYRVGIARDAALRAFVQPHTRAQSTRGNAAAPNTGNKKRQWSHGGAGAIFREHTAFVAPPSNTRCKRPCSGYRMPRESDAELRRRPRQKSAFRSGRAESGATGRASRIPTRNAAADDQQRPPDLAMDGQGGCARVLRKGRLPRPTPLHLGLVWFRFQKEGRI